MNPELENQHELKNKLYEAELQRIKWEQKKTKIWIKINREKMERQRKLILNFQEDNAQDSTQARSLLITMPSNAKISDLSNYISTCSEIFGRCKTIKMQIGRVEHEVATDANLFTDENIPEYKIELI